MMQDIIGTEFKLSNTWTQADIISKMLEAGLVQRREEEGLYDDTDDEVDLGEVGAEGKKKSKKRGKGKKKKGNK
ncbi:hypothetical protein LTR66_016902 [Elasticomyces elasticus]|nr:hypothetical protein LTR66_016902 [Elasticomyces elasticus]